MWIAVEAVDEDDVDEAPTDGGIDLSEAITPHLWSAGGSLEKVSISGKPKVRHVSDGKKAETYHHHHTK